MGFQVGDHLKKVNDDSLRSDGSWCVQLKQAYEDFRLTHAVYWTQLVDKKWILLDVSS